MGIMFLCAILLMGAAIGFYIVYDVRNEIIRDKDKLVELKEKKVSKPSKVLKKQEDLKKLEEGIKYKMKSMTIVLVISIALSIGVIGCSVIYISSSSSSNLSDEEKEWYKNNKDAIDNALDAADRYKGY